ncbi:cytochrome-c peroxidase [Chitinophaga horti]|uniref:Cytochrome-c peroxidase n=1 Tax=Chitinophaga horti TaxID=2920382 RepID=A0ABY6J4Q2_9BACT|nr:cytochrome c peroxidase [Chitinophaga horti]UYQ94480.1 cytochrome-c peroxidase [Chitinophaga horti]
MKKMLVLSGIALVMFAGYAFTGTTMPDEPLAQSYLDSIRSLYARPVAEWPRAHVDDSIQFEEMAVLPPSPFAEDSSLKEMAALGKMLFFEPRLSGSNQISCATCHEPELGWSNGRTTGIGHDHALGERNVPSLFNVWQYKSFFWDGRVNSLEKQVLAPLSNDIEMHELPGALGEELARIPEYKQRFKSVFGGKTIELEHVAEALAMYEKTITSRRAPFDAFVSGRYNAMSDQQVLGMHIFRTKARCMNCHNGPFFTDNKFHNIGLAYYQRKFQDLGLYNITHKKEDVGRFRTPSLRDVALTRPYMHNGLFDDLEGIVSLYNAGGARTKRKDSQIGDTLFPETSTILKPLGMTVQEREAVVAFLHAISTSTSYRVPRPQLPK